MAHRIFSTAFSKVYPLYVQKAERKGRTKAEVDKIICWLTGYTQAGLQKQIRQDKTFEEFFGGAPAMHPNVALIKGVVCGVRVEEVEDPLMRKIRYLDKLVDELAKGKALGDPTRRRLLDLLAADNGQTLGELCEHLDMARQSVTQHLGLLEEANLVSTVWRGREKLHFINPVPLHEVYERWVRKFERQRLSLLHDLKKELEGE